MTWVLGDLWSLPRGVSPRLEWGHAPALSSRGVAACHAPVAWIKGSVAFPRGFPTRLSNKAFPRGFPTGLSHVPPWCESILGLTFQAVLGKQVSLEWTETSGGLWECGTNLEFLSPFLWRAPPLEMRRECREFFPDNARKGSLLSS